MLCAILNSSSGLGVGKVIKSSSNQVALNVSLKQVKSWHQQICYFTSRMYTLLYNKCFLSVLQMFVSFKIQLSPRFIKE